MVQPEVTVQTVKTAQEENPREQLRSVPAASTREAPQQPAGKQADARFQTGGLPMDGGKPLPADMLEVVNPDQDQDHQRENRPDAAFRTGRPLHHGNQEEKQRKGMAGEDGQIQARKLTDQQRNFAQRGEGEKAPADKPIAEITSMLIPAEKEKENQQNNKSGRFEECDAQQALILHEDAAPPAGNALTTVLFLRRNLGWTV